MADRDRLSFNERSFRCLASPDLGIDRWQPFSAINSVSHLSQWAERDLKKNI
jgi:hypothetical protein